MTESSQPRSRYDPAYAARFANAAGESEWRRFDRRLADRVSLEIHRQFLAEFVRADDRVLDAGAGPGRFTIELARLGASVVVGDISPEQLRLNAEKVAEAGVEDRVEARELLDITDLSRFPDASFDMVVCFGGPLSYVYERAEDAARELVRVLRPDGLLLVSVMSKLGAHRIWLDDILVRIADRFGLDAVDYVFTSGDLRADLNDGGHGCQLYTYAELESLLNSAGCDVVSAAASNFLTARHDDLELDAERTRTLIEWDLAACREPGAFDGGTHIVAAARRH